VHHAYCIRYGLDDLCRYFLDSLWFGLNLHPTMVEEREKRTDWGWGEMERGEGASGGEGEEGSLPPRATGGWRGEGL
jgi:hypothetical protein